MQKKAIVIGAGVSGTSAAFRLQQAGCKVHLVEREAQVCGRSLTMHKNGYIVDIGASGISASYTAVLRLMEDAGIKDMLDVVRSPTATFRDGRLHYIDTSSIVGSFFKTKLISFTSKLRMLPIVYKALTMWSSLDFVNMGRAAPFDTDESLAAYSRRVTNEEVTEYFVKPTQKIMYVMSGERSSIIDFFWCLKNLFLLYDSYSVKGGMGRIVELICKQLNVSVSTEVLSVTERGDQVEVVMRDGNGLESTEIADICVIATPACVVPKIDRGLSETSNRYLSQLKFSKYANVHLFLKSRPDEKAYVIMVPDNTDKELGGIMFDHNKASDRAPPGKGLLALYLDENWTRENWSLSDEEIYSIAIAKAEKVMPGITHLVEDYFVQRWDWACTVSHPGSYREMAKFIDSLDMNRRVQLAGDYFALACLNSAVTSGELVAKRLLQNYVL